MQLPLTPPVVLAALLVTGASTQVPLHAAGSTVADPVGYDTAQDVADVPADAGAPDDLQAALHASDPQEAPIPQPRDGGCPAYLGPQCDSAQHEQYASGQAIAALGLTGA